MKQITTLLLLILLFVGCSDDNEPAGSVTVVVNKDGIPQSGAQVRIIESLDIIEYFIYLGDGVLAHKYYNDRFVLPKDWPIFITDKNGKCKINPSNTDYLLLIDLGKKNKSQRIQSDADLITVDF